MDAVEGIAVDQENRGRGRQLATSALEVVDFRFLLSRFSDKIRMLKMRSLFCIESVNFFIGDLLQWLRQILSFSRFN